MITLDIFCDNKTDLPIEQGFKSLYMLQYITEYDNITNSLKKMLINFFQNIPIVDGVKKYKNYTYYSSGVCELNLKQCTLDVLLEPFEIDISQFRNNSKKKKKISASYFKVRKYNQLWYYQIKIYLKRQFKIEYSGNNILENLINYHLQLEKLDSENKKIIESNIDNQTIRGIYIYL